MTVVTRFCILPDVVKVQCYRKGITSRGCYIRDGVDQFMHPCFSRTGRLKVAWTGINTRDPGMTRTGIGLPEQLFPSLLLTLSA